MLVMRDWEKDLSVYAFDSDGITTTYTTYYYMKMEQNKCYSIFDANKGTKGPKVLHMFSLPIIGKYGLYSIYKLLKYCVESKIPCPAKSQITNSIEDADIIHLHSVGPINIPKEIQKKKKIIHFHGFMPRNFNIYSIYFDAKIYISKFQKEDIFFDKEGYVVYNAVIPHERIHEIRTYDFMFAQSDYIEKNPVWVYENIDKYPKFRYVLAGKLKRCGAENLGYLPIDELHKWHARSKIFVLPSIKEAFGLAPLYAMLQGTAPAVSIYSGVREIIPKSYKIEFNPFKHDAKYIYDKYHEKVMHMKEDEIRSIALEYNPYRWYQDLERIYMTLYEQS